MSCFILLKPDAHRRGLVGELITRFERRGYTISNMRYILSPSRNTVLEFYKQFVTKNFFDEIVEFIVEGPVLALVLKGSPEIVRGIVGDTMPHKYAQGSIRGDYSCSIVENLIHYSIEDEMDRDVTLWFSPE